MAFWEMLTMVEFYMVLEDKLNTRFKYPTLVEANSSRPHRKKSYQCQDECDRGMQRQYDKYIPLTVSRKKIYQDCANTEFHKGGVWYPGPVRETFHTNNSKFFHFHKGHDHNIDDCIQLKDTIKGLIKRGWLAEYVQGGKRDREESPKGKSPSETEDVEINDESKKAIKGNLMYIAAITKGAPLENPPQRELWIKRLSRFWPFTKRIQVRQQRLMVDLCWDFRA